MIVIKLVASGACHVPANFHGGGSGFSCFPSLQKVYLSTETLQCLELQLQEGSGVQNEGATFAHCNVDSFSGALANEKP